MEVAVVVLVVLVVLLVGALVRSRRQVARNDQPSGRGSSRELEPVAPLPPVLDQLTAPGGEEPHEFLLEDGSGRQLFAQLIEPGESALWCRADTMITQQSTSVAVDKVLDAVPVIGVTTSHSGSALTDASRVVAPAAA